MNQIEARAFIDRLKKEFPVMGNDRQQSLMDFMGDLPVHFAADAFVRIVKTCDSPFGPTTAAIYAAFDEVAREEHARRLARPAIQRQDPELTQEQQEKINAGRRVAIKNTLEQIRDRGESVAPWLWDFAENYGKTKYGTGVVGLLGHIGRRVPAAHDEARGRAAAERLRSEPGTAE